MAKAVLAGNFAGLMILRGVAADKAVEPDYPIHELTTSSVKLTDNFWKSRVELTARVTVPKLFQELEKNRYISGGLKVAAGVSDAPYFGGFVFMESDLYKSLDAAAESLKNYPDPELEKTIDELGGLIARVQMPDGYLNWPRRAGHKTPTDEGRKYFRGALGTNYYENETRLSHEMFNEGHFIEAAVSYFEATGKTNLLGIARKIGDHLGSWNVQHPLPPSGHPEIEIALMRLYRVTGERRYLEVARTLLEKRGRYPGASGEYNLHHKPLVEQTEAVGHAVCAGYLYASMCELAALTGDQRYAAAAERIWDDAVGRKIYVTGGFGVPADEGFPKPFELSIERSYCETCSSVASLFWGWRMFRLTGDAMYLDVFERTLYNALLSGISLDGRKFNYTNPVLARGNNQRFDWTGTACCPPNIARLLSQVPKYIYATRGNEAFVNLFVGSETSLPLQAGMLHVNQKTRYPLDGKVTLTFSAPAPVTCDLHLRIPCWVRNQPTPGDLYLFAERHETGATVTLNGETVKYVLDRGWAILKRQWNTGDTVELSFPMPIRRVRAHEKVLDCQGMFALQRGPLVFCLETTDKTLGENIDTVVADTNRLPELLADESRSGVAPVLQLSGGFARIGTDGRPVLRPERLEAIPYYAWGNQADPSFLTVWVHDSLANLEGLRPGVCRYSVDRSGLRAQSTFMSDANATVPDTGDEPRADGRLVGDAVTVEDEGGNGKPASAVLEFRGKGYLDCGRPGKVANKGSFTVALWVKFNQSQYWGSVLQRANPGMDGDVAWQVQAPNRTISFDVIDVGKAAAKDDHVIGDGQWHHIVGTYDREGQPNPRVALYIDGRLETRVDAPAKGPYSDRKYVLTAGSRPEGMGAYEFRGRMDDIEYLPKAVGDAGAQALYEAARKAK